MPEALVIVQKSESAGLLPQVSGLAKVTQSLPPRLIIVQGQDAALAAIRGLSGVLAVVSEGAIPDKILQQLNVAERTFAEAWQVRRTPKTSRVGDGLPWDAEGFEPPDKPRGGSKP